MTGGRNLPKSVRHTRVAEMVSGGGDIAEQERIIKMFADTYNMLYFVESLYQSAKNGYGKRVRDLIERRKKGGMPPEQFFDEAFRIFSSALDGKRIKDVNDAAKDYLEGNCLWGRPLSDWAGAVIGLCMLKTTDDAYVGERKEQPYRAWKEAAVSNDYMNPAIGGR